MYQEGKEVPRKDALTAKWYRRAALAGHPLAQANLARMYATGGGVPKDDVRAQACFSLATRQRHAKAAQILDLLANRMTVDELAEAHRLAGELESSANGAEGK